MNFSLVYLSFSTPRLDRSDFPIPNSDLIFHVDGSASCNSVTGTSLVGFAVSDVNSVVFFLSSLYSLHKRQSLWPIPKPVN